MRHTLRSATWTARHSPKRRPKFAISYEFAFTQTEAIDIKEVDAPLTRTCVQLRKESLVLSRSISNHYVATLAAGEISNFIRNIKRFVITGRLVELQSLELRCLVRLKHDISSGISIGDITLLKNLTHLLATNEHLKDAHITWRVTRVDMPRSVVGNRTEAELRIRTKLQFAALLGNMLKESRQKERKAQAAVEGNTEAGNESDARGW